MSESSAFQPESPLDGEVAEPNIWAKRSYRWGINTWIGNALGCAIGMVPLALPLGIALTIATLGTGFYSLGTGLIGLTRAEDKDRKASRWHCWVGIGLSAAHLIIVIFVALAVYVFTGGIPGLKF